MNTSTVALCQGTSGIFGQNTNPPRPCGNRAKPGTNYCTYHAPGYERPTSKTTLERWRKQDEARKKLAEKDTEILRLLAWMGGHTNPWLGHNVARELRNTAREMILKFWPDSEKAKEVKQWMEKNP